MSADGYVRACALSEVPDEGALAVEVDDTPIAVVRAEGGGFALSNICSHAEGELGAMKLAEFADLVHRAEQAA